MTSNYAVGESKSVDNTSCGVKGVVVPDSKDILLGRGKGIELHKGSEWLNCMIEGLVQLYSQEKWGNKQEVVRGIINLAYEEGRRFLRLNKSGVWEDAREKELMAKLAQALRHKRRLLTERTSKQLRQCTKGKRDGSEVHNSGLHTSAEPCLPVAMVLATTCKEQHCQEQSSSPDNIEIEHLIIEPTPLLYGSVANQRQRKKINSCISSAAPISSFSNPMTMNDSCMHPLAEEHPSPSWSFVEATHRNIESTAPTTNI